MAGKATQRPLSEGYQQIIKELEDTQNQWLILKRYYLEVKEILHQTNFLEPKDKEDFEAGVNRCLADLEREKCTVLIAGETSAGKSSLINLLLNERVLPASVRQNTLTICEISYGPEKEAVLHFHDQSKPASILKGEEFEKQMKTYIQKLTEDKDWCEKIEIRLPNTLLKSGIVIVDSPGIGDTESIASIVMKYLPQANAFIYVINSSNAGGLHEDRLLRILSEWKKLYDGRKESGITYESALFICNKWDLVEEEDDENEGKELEKEIIGKLRERIPLLDEECQVVKMSVKRAAKELLNSGEMNDDLYSLICGMKDLLPRFAKMKAALLYLECFVVSLSDFFACHGRKLGRHFFSSC